MIQTNERDSTTRIAESPRRETLRGLNVLCCCVQPKNASVPQHTNQVFGRFLKSLMMMNTENRKVSK
jgi:hypothetical protein